MDVNAFGLAAGRKHAKARRPLPNAFLARNVNPRKSNDWFGKSPRRFASLQYTVFVFSGCKFSLQAARRSASALHNLLNHLVIASCSAFAPCHKTPILWIFL